MFQARHPTESWRAMIAARLAAVVVSVIFLAPVILLAPGGWLRLDPGQSRPPQ